MEPIESSGDVVVCDDDDEQQNGIFESEEEMKRAFSRLCYGDLYIIGTLWIHALRTVLVGANFTLFPTVEAAKPPEPPQKPPKLRYKDLPIYQCPHYEYKDYIASKGSSCPAANTKLAQQALLPCVRKWRKQASDFGRDICSSIRDAYKDVSSSIDSSKKDLKKTMRDPANLSMRRGVVATGSLIGYLLGGGGGIPRRAFFTSLGALGTGSLCFPKETDEIFRDVAYHTAKMILRVYNGVCGKKYALRERVPCKEDMPEEPKPRKPLCPQK